MKLARLYRSFVVGLGVAACSLAATTAPAAANPKYAALVVHAETGDILFDRYADEERYPASLTKMMTLYLLFEEIEAGNLSLTSELPVSRRAAAQPASRLGVQRGTTIDVETAIEALIIRSANDVATVVAEKLGGTENRFARMMTAKARELGMRNTTFRNASGLPDEKQTTTARDMALLSQRVMQDFPDFFPYFARTTFTWKGETYRSHNRVTTSLLGADGMKTGYTRASGYNLATTAERSDHRLIGVVMGGRSGRTRNAHMEDILNKAFLEIDREPDMIKRIHYARPTPRLRPDRDPSGERPVLLANADLEVTPEAVDAPRDPAMNLASLEAAISQLDISRGEYEVALTGEGDAEAPATRDWIVQVGAFGNQNQAIARIHSTQDVVRDIFPEAIREVNIAERRRDPVYRARFTQLTENEAARSCAQISQTGGDCIAIQVDGE